MKKKNRMFKNLVISILTQLITLALGLILPRIILVSWGSEYNGLISTVTTIMRYFSLLEAGVNVSTLQAFYKSVANDDKNETSVIIKTSQNYYHKMSLIYALLIFIFAFGYPAIITSDISYWEIVIIIALQGMTGLINFAFRAAYQQLLNAEGKYYIISIITLFTTIFTYLAKIVAIIVFDNIIVMQALSVIVILIQALVYLVYFKRRYAWIDNSVSLDYSLLSDRKYYLVQQIASLIFNSTDTFVLSMFCGLKYVSVYTIYNMVYSALTALISMVRNSLNYVLGQAFHKNKEYFNQVYKAYLSFQITLGSILTSTGIMLIIGFVKLYTKGVNDINYIDFIAAILFSLNIILDCSRGAGLAALNIAGKASKTTNRYIIEAAINLLVSLVLVGRLGIKGVLLGTVTAGIYRSIDTIIYINKYVLHKKSLSEFSYIVGCLIIFSLFSTYAYRLPLNIKNYIDFCVLGFACFIISFLIYGIFYLIYNREILYLLINKRREKNIGR